MRISRSILQALKGRPLDPASGSAHSNIYRLQIPKNSLDLWIFRLPDSFAALSHGQLKESFGEITVFGPAQQLSEFFDPNLAPAILSLAHEQFFIQALVPLPGLVVWVQISSLDALQMLSAFELIRTTELKHLNHLPSSCWGRVANLIYSSAKTLGLHSMAEISFSDELMVPVCTKLYEDFSPFPGLGSYMDSSSALLDDIETESKAHLAHDHFELGRQHEKLEDYSKAAECYHQAQLLDHPLALHKEWEVLSKAAKPFRTRYKEAFALIARGERLRALTHLRNAAHHEPLHGNAILAYALRNVKEPREGIKACEIALGLLPDQSDVLAHKWSYLTELKQDSDALETAREHLRRYPREPNAALNAIDSLCLTGDAKSALIMAFLYALNSSDPNLISRQFFKVYEQLESWNELADFYDRFLPIVSGPTAETLAAYGDALIEARRCEEAFAQFERALSIEPGNSKVALGYARGLAREGKEDLAEQFLCMTLADKNRIDKPADRVFLITMLAEIRRRTGRAKEALETFESELTVHPLELAEITGPFPALEYAESLLELGNTAASADIVSELSKLFPDDPFVSELWGIIKSDFA